MPVIASSGLRLVVGFGVSPNDLLALLLVRFTWCHDLLLYNMSGGCPPTRQGSRELDLLASARHSGVNG